MGNCMLVYVWTGQLYADSLTMRCKLSQCIQYGRCLRVDNWVLCTSRRVYDGKISGCDLVADPMRAT